MVERYLLKKHLMKPLHVYQEMKRQKLQNQQANQEIDKATFGEVGNCKTPGQSALDLMDQPSSTMFDATDLKTSVAASSSKNESELPIREVCCCSWHLVDFLEMVMNACDLFGGGSAF